jgi:hypothetical protein
MTLISRLETISSSLSQMFEQGSEVQQRKAVRAACSKAVSDVNLTGSEIEMALQLIASGVGDPDLHDKLNAIAGEFDEKYFDLTDDADNTQELSDAQELTKAASAHFQKARAVAALAYGVSDNRNDLREALYEAISAGAKSALNVSPVSRHAVWIEPEFVLG